MVFRRLIFSSGLPVMALLAQSLPVALIPEQPLITSMRDHMVDNRGLHVLSFLPLYTVRTMGWLGGTLYWLSATWHHNPIYMQTGSPLDASVYEPRSTWCLTGPVRYIPDAYTELWV